MRVYWVDHLCDAQVSDGLRDDGPAHTFLGRKILYWFEALSLLKEIPHGVKSLAKLDELLKGKKGKFE